MTDPLNDKPMIAAQQSLLNDIVLRDRYEALDRYDRAALSLKYRYVAPRVLVLLLGFLTSFLAVASAGNPIPPSDSKG